MAENKWIIDGHHYTCPDCKKTIAIVVNESDEDFEFCPFCGKRMSGQMAENELKPCQCGSAAELCRGDDDYYIYCPKCKLKTFSDKVYDNITDNCDRLIEAWNRRVEDGRE